jgi:uncharacterized protein (DUF2062 family)/2-polyprenyl-3-methyl-5-hydroxy-6-metoxy-1,4-benzoquinol methylase
MTSRTRIRALLARLWSEHASPARLGAAVGVGVVVGCSPFFGLHLPIGLGLALLFRLNKIAVVLGSQISIPPLAPLLGFASVQLGSRILEGGFLTLGAADFTLTWIPELLGGFFRSWLLGGLLVGLALGLPAGLITGIAVRMRRGPARRDPWRAELDAALLRYREAPRGHRGYLRFKLPMDPVYRMVCEELGEVDTLVDLGTGLGVLPILLAQRGQVRHAIGIEWDASKAASARKASAGLGAVEIREGDAREAELPPTDAVLMIDLLHYYPLEEQRALLARAAAALRPGGRLAVRETVREGRSALTRIVEGIAVALRWNKGPGLCYLTEAELRAELERLGLRCAEAAGASSSLHKGNLLLWARAGSGSRSV